VSRAKANEGFGLIEAVVALTLLGVMLVSLLPALSANMSTSTTGDLRTGAVAAAQETLDRLRFSGEAWPASGSREDVSSGETIYNVEITHAPLCDLADCIDDARRVALEVSHNGQVLYQVETAFTALDR